MLEVVGSFKELVFSQHSREVVHGNSQHMTVCTKPARAQTRQNPDYEEREAGVKAHLLLGGYWYLKAFLGVKIGFQWCDSWYVNHTAG